MNRSLLISTGIGCGVLCSYCPQVAIGQAYKKVQGPSSMSLEIFKSCIDKLPEDVTVDFTGFYEPFLNPHCTDMILYAADRGLPVRLSTTVMGLEPEQIDRFKHIPFVKFSVHLPDTKKLTRIIVDERYMAALSQLTEAGICNIGFHVHEGIDGPRKSMCCWSRAISSRKTAGSTPAPAILQSTRNGLRNDWLANWKFARGFITMCCSRAVMWLCAVWTGI
jgi:hypothetical protein